MGLSRRPWWFKVALLALIATAVLALIIWAPETHERRGNTVGNIVNEGLVAKEGQWIYYRNLDDDDKIYKIRTDGTGRTRISDDNSWCINVVDGRVRNITRLK